MYPVRQLLHGIFKERGGLVAVGHLVKPGMDELRGAIDGPEQVGPAFAGADFTYIEMQIADGICPERLSFRPGLGLAWQLTDVVALVKTMQAGAAQVRDKMLKRKQAVIQRQAGGPAKSDGRRLFYLR